MRTTMTLVCLRVQMTRRCVRTVLIGMFLAAGSSQSLAAETAGGLITKDPATLKLMLSTTTGQAQAAVRPGGASGRDLVTLNFVNADIEGVVKAVGEITGRNFVIDPRVKGSINIISAQPMARSLVYGVFLSALRLQGFAAVEDGGVVKILPEADAKLHKGEVSDAQDKPRGPSDQIQTRIFRLKHESATQMLTILRPLITPSNAISALPNSNSLIITDYAGNLQRLERIIDSLDQSNGSDPIAIPLRNASAFDVVQTINRMFAETATAQTPLDPAQRFTVVPDARSNSVLARSGDPSRLARIRQLAAMLDSPTSAAGNMHVVYLKNAEATKVAETLRAIFAQESAPPRQPSSPFGSTSAAPGLQPSAAIPSAVSALAPAAPGNQGIIQADAATNSIIITAPDAVYNNIRGVIEKLDVRRAQVYVEALIAELTADKAAEFGIQWQDLSGAAETGGALFGGTNFGNAGQNILGIAQAPLAAGRGLNVGVMRGTVTIGGTRILNLGLLVRALESNNNANILSTPTLLTLDNEEAKIVIGQNVPFITGQYAISGAATTPTPFQTIERKDVGLTLRIKPQISEGGAVRLQIYQEVSSIQDRTNVAGVITNKRSVESTVLVDDGQIVVIGGLMQDSVSDGLEKVPVLGDLPVLGSLFRYNTRSRSKTNLMVFLRPTLLRNAQGADALTSQRYDFIRSEQQNAAPPPSAVLPEFRSPVLPQRAPVAPESNASPK